MTPQKYYMAFVFVIIQNLFSLVLTAAVPRDRIHSNELIIDTALNAMRAAHNHTSGDVHPWNSDVTLPGNEVIGFDIILTPEQMRTLRKRPQRHQRRTKRKAISSRQYHWPNGIIPYIMDESIKKVSPWAQYVLYAAMKHWMIHTCIKFVPYSREKHGIFAHRVAFASGQWCSSHLGKTGGLQFLFIHANCLRRGTIIHELGHTIGWFHEHARPDRDQYVSILWHRVDEDTKEQYRKENELIVRTYGIPYDYESIMHYPNHNGELVTLDGRYQHLIGQREGLSFLDKKLANKMYECAGHCPASVQCREPGYVDKDCECVCQDGSEQCVIVSQRDHTDNDHVTEQNEECYWRYKAGESTSIHIKAEYQVENIDQCKLRCLEQRSFACRSFHYITKRLLWFTVSSACALTDQWASDRKFISSSSSVYYETPTCLLNHQFCGWRKINSLLMSVADRDGKVNYNLALDECRLTCLEEQEFVCRSFLFRKFPSGNTVCVHTRITKDQASSTESYPTVDYYEKRACQVTSSPPTERDV